MKLRCPSKTFLVGEYAVLNGGPCLLLATEPYFTWENQTFLDPHRGLGGFGASGAKFVFEAYLQGCLDAAHALKKFRDSPLSTGGSGADIVCQYTGGVTYFHPEKNIIEKLDWPFSDLSIFLIHTGHKILTHQHLEKHSNIASLPLAQLQHVVQFVHRAILEKDSTLLLYGISQYHTELDKLGLICDNTHQLLQKIYQRSEVLAAKGCGALGADVILVVTSHQDNAVFKSWALQQDFNIVFSGNTFAHGIQEREKHHAK